MFTTLVADAVDLVMMSKNKIRGLRIIFSPI